MKYVAVIPARYASTRFPAKPLAMLGGKTVIQRVYEQVIKVINDTYVATDDERIANEVKRFGGRVVMTSPDHKSGTDRVNEVVKKIKRDFDVVINVQGDEPFVHEEQIRLLCECFKDKDTDIATLQVPFHSMEEVKNVNSPKVIRDIRGFALYFTRSVVPYIRGVDEELWIEKYPFMKHIGMYAYRCKVLNEITALPQSELEKAESLEQLRWLENNYRIKVATTNIETIGIDTPEDLKKAEYFLLSLPH